MIYKLTIAIPTVKGRERQFAKLYSFLDKQRTSEVEIIYELDNKELSIGTKRDILYNRAQGVYTVQVDDDDTVCEDYVPTILNNIKDFPDCVGYYEHCTIDGQHKRSEISLRLNSWETFSPARSGVDYFRTPYFKVPILTTICKEVGVKDMRFGEDHDFAQRIFNKLRNCKFIDKYMYYYSANSLTPQEHNERYGINRIL